MRVLESQQITTGNSDSRLRFEAERGPAGVGNRCLLIDGIVFAFVALMLLANAVFASAQIRAIAHLDKGRYLADAPVFVVWDYTNLGPTAVPFDRNDPYCPQPWITAPKLSLAVPTIFPAAYDVGAYDCTSTKGSLRAGETFETKFLLNDRFDLSAPGKYNLVVPLGHGINRTVNLSLVLQPASERALRAAYQPYLNALELNPAADLQTAIRVLADSDASFAEPYLLRYSIDPLSGGDLRRIANEGLGRLRGPGACARLAELAAHPELHFQQSAIQEMAQCGARYMLFLFQLAQFGLPDQADRDFALASAGEAGGEAAVDRLLGLMLQPSVNREAVLYALARTGSSRATAAIIDALPSLVDADSRYGALQALKTLTHHESREKDYEAQVWQGKRWWANPENRKTYKPRDWSVPLIPLN
jgi:hypothetical protein